VRPLQTALLGLLVAMAALVCVAFLALLISVPVGLTKLYRVPSSAMEPTLHCAQPGVGCEAEWQDRVVVCRWCFWFRGPRRGDIVAFHTPDRALRACGSGGVFLKRVVGIPGDRWEERRGFVYIDGNKLAEPYVDRKRRDRKTYAPVRLGPGEYFLLGDNRSSSCDSRNWGALRRKALIGRLIATYWPPSRISIR
jgi:signal peptidase I